MADNPPVNRYLEDKAMDHIDHALGRPMWPLRESYRNYFATEADSPHGESFEASPHWETGGCDGRLTYYHVTDAGRKALDAYLIATGRDRRFVVSYRGFDKTVAALTAGKARYSAFLDLRDAVPDVRLIDLRVRRAA